MLVDRPGDQFPAGPHLAQDQHALGLGGDPAHLLEHRSHRGARTDQQIGIFAPLLGLLEQRWSAHGPRRLGPLLHDAAEHTRIEGLDQVVVGSAAHRLDGRVGRAMPGDEHDHRPRIDPAELLEHLQPIGLPQPNVKQDHIGRDRLHHLAARVGRVGLVDLGVQAGKHLPDTEPNARFVIDNQQFQHRGFTLLENPPPERVSPRSGSPLGLLRERPPNSPVNSPLHLTTTATAVSSPVPVQVSRQRPAPPRPLAGAVRIPRLPLAGCEPAVLPNVPAQSAD